MPATFIVLLRVAYRCTHARTTTATCIHTSTATPPKSHLLPPTHPAAAVHRQRPSPDRTKLRMTNTCEQTKHSIHGIQNFLFKRCQQTPLLGKHKLRSQALVDEIRQPPSIHNIGTYPPPNGHAGCDTTHRLTHKRPHLCQSSRSRTRQPTDQKTISSRSPLAG